jgi:hypothetical protein
MTLVSKLTIPAVIGGIVMLAAAGLFSPQVHASGVIKEGGWPPDKDSVSILEERQEVTRFGQTRDAFLDTIDIPIKRQSSGARLRNRRRVTGRIVRHARLRED